MPSHAPARALPDRDARLLALCTATSSLDRFVLPPLLLAVAAGLGTSLMTVTLAASLHFLLYGLGQVVWGTLSDRFGRVPVLRAALTGAAVGAVLSAASPSVAVFVVARALTGACIGGVTPTTLVYVGDAVPLEQRQRPLARQLSASSAAIALAIGGGGLAAAVGAWRLALLVPGVAAVLLVVALRRLPEPGGRVTPGRAPDPALQRIGRVLRNRWALAVLGLALVEGAVVLGSLTFVPTALVDAGVAAAVAGLVTALYGVSSALASRWASRAGRRLGDVRLLALGGTLVGVAPVVLAVTQHPVAGVVGMTLLGAGFGVFHPVLQAWATDVAPQDRGTGVAVFAASLFVGSSLATAAAAPLADARQFATLFGVTAAAAVPLTVAAVLGRRRYAAARQRAAA